MHKPASASRLDLDLAPITQHLRAVYRSRLLVAAVHHLGVFDRLARGSIPLLDLQNQLQLKERPTMVLFPALRAMGLLRLDADQAMSLTALGQSLTKTSQPNLTGYVGLEAEDPGVLNLVDLLKNDGPRETNAGIAYVKEGTDPSPMDHPETARHLTMALAGRAEYLSPVAAAILPRRKGHLLDVAGGSGWFAFEWLKLNPDSTATILDRNPVLGVAREFLERFCAQSDPAARSIQPRVEFVAGNMLEDPLPKADLVLAASLFHDWPTPTCRLLAQRFADALRPGGELWVHDAFLDDSMDGPLPVTDYSTQLFCFTKGRCYSRAEYRDWMRQSKLIPASDSPPTLMDYGLLLAAKPN